MPHASSARLERATQPATSGPGKTNHWRYQWRVAVLAWRNPLKSELRFCDTGPFPQAVANSQGVQRHATTYAQMFNTSSMPQPQNIPWHRRTPEEGHATSVFFVSMVMPISHPLGRRHFPQPRSFSARSGSRLRTKLSLAGEPPLAGGGGGVGWRGEAFLSHI